MRKNNYNLYPIYIVIFFLIMVIMIVLTIYISIKFKPDEDNAYFSTRQEVDKNINFILNNQKILESKYDFYILDGDQYIALQNKANKKSNPIVIHTNPITFKILVKQGKTNIKADSIRLYITRFADSKDDIDIGKLDYVEEVFLSSDIFLKKGNWKVLIEISIEGKKAYFEQRVVINI